MSVPGKLGAILRAMTRAGPPKGIEGVMVGAATDEETADCIEIRYVCPACGTYGRIMFTKPIPALSFVMAAIWGNCGLSLFGIGLKNGACFVGREDHAGG